MKKNNTLIKELDHTLSLFQELLMSIERLPSHAEEVENQLEEAENQVKKLEIEIEEPQNKRQTQLDYSFVGSLNSVESLYPSTLYSRLQHLRHVVATLERRNEHLPESVIDSMLDILQNQKLQSLPVDGDQYEPPLGNASALNEVIRILTKEVASEAAWKDEIRYLLKQSNQRSDYLNLDVNLPDLVNSLFEKLFLEWRNKVIYEEDTPQDHNVFSLLEKLKKIANDPAKPPLHPLDIPIGSINNDDPNTLFGKAILTQKIVLNSVISKFVPIHYEQLYHLLDDSKESVITALNDTIRYVSGESSTAPAKSIETCFDEIHLLFKKVLIERIMILPDKTERNKNSLENLMKIISDNLILIEPNFPQLTLLKKHFFKPTPNYHDQNELYYNQDSLFARIKSIFNILMHPHYILDYTVFDEWNALIGNENDISQNTGIGLLKACFGEVNKVNKQASDHLDAAVAYVGKAQDVFTLKEEKHSFYGIINRLFRLVFQQLLGWIEPNKDDSLPVLMKKFSERFDDASQLAAIIGDSQDPVESLTLCGRINLLCDSIHQLIKDNQFNWADLVVQSLYQELPEIQAQLKRGIELPQYDLWKYFGKAWWSHHEIYQPLNNLINAVLGGGIHQAFSYHNPKVILIPNTLQNYVDLIHENLEKTKNVTGALQAVIGDKIDHGIHLEKVLTLQNRFYYLHEIIQDLPIFLDYETAQALYHQLVSDSDQGLLVKFDALNDLLVKINILNEHAGSSSEINRLINQALRIIGAHTDKPGMETIASIMNSFFDQSSTIFFNLILNKFTASKFGLYLENKHSLYDDVLRLQEFLNHHSNPDMNETWNLIGNNWDNKYTPSIFGRLASIQDVLLNLWNEAYYIPFYKILELAAQFHENINDIMHNSWTHYSVMNVGTPISFIEENSLFGNLNHMIDASLTVALKSSFEQIQETLFEIQQKINQTMSLNDAEKKSLVEFIGHSPTAEPYADFAHHISNAFHPVAGFLRLHQTEQFLQINHKTEGLLGDVNEYLQEIYNKCSIPASEIIETIYHKIGNASDVMDQSPETVFSLTNNLAIRLYCIYSTLNKWMDDSNFLNIFNYLTAVKQKFFPGECQLFYLSYNLRNFHHLFKEINDNVELSIDHLLASDGVIQWDGGLEDAVLSFHRLTDPLQQIERMLPSALASSKGELARCSDMSEHIVDMISFFSDFRYRMLKGLGRMLFDMDNDAAVANDPIKWSCKEVPLSIQQIAEDFHRQNNMMDFLMNHIDPLLQHLEQATPLIAIIQKFKDAIVEITPPLQSIQKNIRSHANTHRTFHCLHCNVKTVASAWEAMTGEIEELTTKMETLIESLIRKCEGTLFKQSYEALHAFFDQNKASWMKLFPVSYEPDGLPSISPTGDVQFQKNSMLDALVEMKNLTSALTFFTMNQKCVDHEESCAADYAVNQCMEDCQTDSLKGSNDEGD